MRSVVAACVGEIVVLGRCSVRVRFSVLLLVVNIESSTMIARVCDGVNDDVAIE